MNCKWFLNLSNSTKNQHLVKVKKCLKFLKRKDLIEALGKKGFKENRKTLSKNELVSRDDLELILKHCNLKLRTLIMVMYEGALRIDETLNIRFKHVKFNSGYVNLRIETSKSFSKNGNKLIKIYNLNFFSLNIDNVRLKDMFAKLKNDGIDDNR